MSGSIEETYSTMFSSLKHPVRRKILRMLSEKSMTFSQMLDQLKVSSSHLTYHLESLGELLTKLEDGRYKLSTFGEACVLTMRGVEDTPTDFKKSLFSLNIKWKALFTVLIIGLIMASSFSTIQVISINHLSEEHEILKKDVEKLKAENELLLSWAGGTDKSIEFIREIIKIDTGKYKASMVSHNIENRMELGGVLEETIRYSLTSDTSRMDIALRYRNNHFSRYQLFLDEGSPKYLEPYPSDPLIVTKNVIERYKSYTDQPYLPEILEVINLAIETGETEVGLGNTKLLTSSVGNYKEIFLMYTEEGVDFSTKSLRLVFHNDVLIEFTDGWFLLTVGSTEVNVSQEQAIEIARNYAKDFSWTVNGTEVTEFTVLDYPVTTQFIPHPREEYLALIPYWYVILNLDRVYPGEISRIGVGIWADTGEVRDILALR